MHVALDVGGSSIKAGLVASLHGVGDVTRTPLNHHHSAEALIASFADAIESVAAHDNEISGVAIAMPDPFEHDTGLSRMEHKFAALYGLALGDEIGSALRERAHRASAVPMRWCNDAAAAVAGEAVAGAGVGYSRVFGITLGTGLGAAFTVDGVLGPEVDGVVIGNLWQTPSGVGGSTADDVLSARAYVRRITAGATPAEYGTDLGRFLAPLAARFDADVVVVGGGGIASFDAFAPATQRHVSAPVVAAALDRWAPLIGAVTLTF